MSASLLAQSGGPAEGEKMPRRPHHSDDDDDDDAPPAAVSLASSKAAAKERSQLERDTRSGAAAANKFARKERAAAQTGDLRTDATPFPVELLPDVAAELEREARAAPPPTVDGDGGAAAAAAPPSKKAQRREERRAQRREERGAPAVVRRGAENTAYAVLPPADSLSLGLAPSQSGLREFLDAQLYGDRVPRVAGATLAALRKQRPAANFATAAPPAAAARSAAGAKRRRQRERRAQQPKAPKVVDLAAATSLDRRAAKMKRDAAAGRSSRKYG